MKKTLILLGVAALAVFASCKKEAPQDYLTLVSAPTEVIPVAGTEEPLTITFKASKAWTASVNAEVAEFVNLTPTSGAADDNAKVKLTVAKNEVNEDRTIVVTLKSEGVEPLKVTMTQASPAHFIVNPEGPVEVSKDGGEFTITISTNCEFELKDYHDGSFPWQSAVLSEDKKTATVTIGANTGYDPRQSYVKFTIPAIQVPVLDEEGNPTEETEALTVRVYFNQEGLTTISWSKVLPEALKNGTQLSMAKLGDNYFLYDGVSEPQKFNPSTGEITAAGITIPDGITVTEVFNDDAGNFLVATPAEYGHAFDIFALAAGETDMTKAKVLVHAYFDYYGYGLGHFHARGDVLNDGIVTALIADGPAAGVPVTGAYWEISDGKATTWAKYGETEEQTCQPKYVTFTTAGEIWLANRADFAPLGTSAAAGFLYDGYDGTYALQHHVGGTTTPLATIGDWANGVSCIQSGVWGQKPVVAVNNMAWFPYWAMPSVLTIFDASTMAPITTVNILGEGLEATYMAEPSTAVLFEQKGDALIVYSADGAQGLLQKIVIPAAN